MHWSNTGNIPELFFVDGRVFILLIAMAFYPRWITLYMVLAAIIFSVALKYFGYDSPNFFRLVRVKLAGPVIKSKPWWRQPTFHRVPRP